ncbi:hypothetical protein BFP97_17105 [Roseivirga sp. 4D4]|uniref:hypothetical protein n=1 Tax=Roseivirga sp. 4D4 TaxID=1889784 RepID=UPI0008537AAD|nr:hypothetical protein [Roseivirga sp. 4D4]OEK03133.1 hypothetical protein BFP97_17105 [Roseivirga sp. 4D4]
MKKLFFIALLLISANLVKAQVGFSYHQSTLVSSFGISTNPDKKIWGEARIGANSTEFDITAMALYNVVEREDFKLYSGLGLGTTYQDGNFALALGFQVKPIEKKDNFTLFGEYTPLFSSDEGSFLASGSIGIRYFLKRKK